MKILFVLEDNFPESGACTSLVNNIIHSGGMIDKVSLVDVLAVKNKYLSRKTEKINGVTVYNCALLSKIPTWQYKCAIKQHPIKLSAIVLRKLFTFRNTGLIEKAVDKDNVKTIEKTIKDIKKKYDIIIAVMGRFDVAAAAVKHKKKNPDVKLIIYQVDPCSSNEMYSLSAREELKGKEKEIYNVSDKIITTPILFDESKEKYSDEMINKIIPMEFPNVVPVDDGNREETSDIRCLFTGSIYGNFRDPKYTLKLFDKAELPIGFEVIGSVKPEVKSEFTKHSVLYHGPKPLEETKAELAKADVLVNIGNDMLNQVPSKLFEYISYGKPIINICKNRNCPTIPYLEKYKYALNLYEEDDIFEEQVKLLNDFILENHKNRMTADEILEAFETCTPQYCAGQMIEVFKTL